MFCYVVKNDAKSRRIFRRVSRNATGNGVEPLADDIIFFAKHEDEILGVASLRMSEERWDAEEECAHVLPFLFIDPREQRKGYGSQLLRFVENYAWTRSCLPIKLESAQNAVEFFSRYGYVAVGSPIDCICPSSPQFRTLQKMVKEVQTV